MTDPTLPPGPESPPSVNELLLARIDAQCRLISLELDQLATACAQLHPERARSCATAIIFAKTGIDEVRLRAHARPLDDGGGLNSET